MERENKSALGGQLVDLRIGGESNRYGEFVPGMVIGDYTMSQMGSMVRSVAQLGNTILVVTRSTGGGINQPPHLLNLIRSTDGGLTWEVVFPLFLNAPSIPGGTTWYGMAAGNGVFVLCRAGQAGLTEFLVSSDNGDTWTFVPSPSLIDGTSINVSTSVRRIAFNGHIFLAIAMGSAGGNEGTNGSILISSDGYNWQRPNVFDAFGFFNFSDAGTGLTTDGSRFVFVAQGSMGAWDMLDIWETTDGRTFGRIGAYAGWPTGVPVLGVRDNHVFLGFGWNNAFTSNDYNNWEEIMMPSPVGLRAVRPMEISESILVTEDRYWAVVAHPDGDWVERRRMITSIIGSGKWESIALPHREGNFNLLYVAAVKAEGRILAIAEPTMWYDNLRAAPVAEIKETQVTFGRVRNFYLDANPVIDGYIHPSDPQTLIPITDDTEVPIENDIRLVGKVHTVDDVIPRDKEWSIIGSVSASISPNGIISVNAPIEDDTRVQLKALYNNIVTFTKPFSHAHLQLIDQWDITGKAQMGVIADDALYISVSRNPSGDSVLRIRNHELTNHFISVDGEYGNNILAAWTGALQGLMLYSNGLFLTGRLSGSGMSGQRINRYYTSKDCINWTARGIIPSWGHDDRMMVAASNGTFMSEYQRHASWLGVFTTTDGLTTTHRPIPGIRLATGNLYGYYSRDDGFMIFGNEPRGTQGIDAVCWYSPDAISWARYMVIPERGSSSSYMRELRKTFISLAWSDKILEMDDNFNVQESQMRHLLPSLYGDGVFINHSSATGNLGAGLHVSYDNGRSWFRLAVGSSTRALAYYNGVFYLDTSNSLTSSRISAYKLATKT